MIAESWQKAQQGKMGGDMDSMMGGMDRPKKSENTKPAKKETAKDKKDLNDMMDIMKDLNDNDIGLGKPGDDKNYDPMKAMDMMKKLENMRSRMEQEK